MEHFKTKTTTIAVVITTNKNSMMEIETKDFVDFCFFYILLLISIQIHKLEYIHESVNSCIENV